MVLSSLDLRWQPSISIITCLLSPFKSVGAAEERRKIGGGVKKVEIRS